MPKKSAASLSVVSPNPVMSLPRPSNAAPPEVAALFAEILQQVPRDHFKEADALLLEALCQATLLGRKAYAELAVNGPVVGGRRSPWLDVLQASHKSSAILAARLRLAPQSRADSRSAGRQATGLRPSIYELMRDER
jgi:phage terminase small subunit